jgi:D-alanyl-D-alanine carboxypeptidase (penicillin-binding protein 5/6)
MAPTVLLTGTVRLGTPAAIPWPTAGAAAIMVEGLGSLGASGPSTPRPMASTAKMMTALLSLEAHPFLPGQVGPTIVVTSADVANYQRDLRLGASVVAVTRGEKLSEYQLLQGLMLPSASNFADILATWDAGSLPAFIALMNGRAAALGMTHTHYADASGLSPESVSVPTDLIMLGRTAMAIPVFKEIVAQTQTTLPVAGMVHNLDTLLGKDGVIGVKTGHTNEAGGCFVFAAEVAVGGQTVRIYGAVMGQPGQLPGAFKATTRLLQAATASLHTRRLIGMGDIVGEYRSAWSTRATVAPAREVSFVVYDGIEVHRSVELGEVKAPLPSGSTVGSLVLLAGEQRVSVALRTTGPITEPDFWWRLSRGS